MNGSRISIPDELSAEDRSLSATTTDANQHDSRLRATIERHLHPRHGSAYWLRRQERLGIDVADRIRSVRDLPMLGPTCLSDMSAYSVWDFLPNRSGTCRADCVLSESGGTSGRPTSTIFLTAEFHSAFVSPFVQAAQQAGFPFGREWLWVGPTGPHIIGKAVRSLATGTGSPDPWSVDFDPRWARKLVPSSFAARRYLAHVIDQAVDILQRETPEVLFTTPPVLDALADRLDDAARSRFLGVHYGGMAITPEQINRFRELYPNAVHLSGYGNSMCGVAMELHDEYRSSIDYFPRGERLIYDVVRLAADMTSWTSVEHGERGRVMFHRLDDSAFLPNVIERDEAELVLPPAEDYRKGWTSPGLRDPAPPPEQTKMLKAGLY